MAFGLGIADSDRFIDEARDLNMLKEYLGVERVPCLIRSPMRLDRGASFSIFKGRKGGILYKDHGTGESGSVLKLISLLTGETRAKLIEDFGNKTIKNHNRLQMKVVDQIIDISVTTREFSAVDEKYWSAYGISTKDLTEFGVYAVKTISINRGSGYNTFPAEVLSYAYVENKDGRMHIKVYQPKSQKLKWLSNTDASVWNLWTLLPPQGKRLIITSSRKDAMCLWKALGIPATAMQSEGTKPNHKVMMDLFKRFEEVYLLYDNDFDSSVNNGQHYAAVLREKYPRLINLVLPKDYGCKDPSDLAETYGVDVMAEVVLTLMYHDGKQEDQGSLLDGVQGDQVPF